MSNSKIISAITSIVDDVYKPLEYPALDMLTQEWTQQLPFSGVRVLVATPIFRNTLLEYRALLSGGAKLVVGCAFTKYSMPYDKKIVEFLKNIGVEVVTPQEVLVQESEGEFFDLILDCAGQFSMCHPRYGFVELTRSGVHFFEDLNVPVFVADSGIVKRIETSLGTGEGYIRALRQLGFNQIEGRKFVVFGSGKVGVGIVLQLLREGAHVYVVTDPSLGENVFLHANDVPILSYRDVDAVAKLICHVDFVVTATGVKNALDIPQITQAILESKAVFANMGVEDEYGPQVPSNRVLSGKSPLNFILEEPTHLKYIDASLALHAALAERKLQEVFGSVQTDDSCQSNLRTPPEDIEQRILMVSIQNGLIGPEINELLGFSSEP